MEEVCKLTSFIESPFELNLLLSLLKYDSINFTVLSSCKTLGILGFVVQKQISISAESVFLL
jgi:hypothetical protein